MNSSMKEANDLLASIADVNETLIAIRTQLRARSVAGEVHHGCDFRKLNEGCMVDMYVEIEVVGGTSYCWWLEVRVASEGWRVEASLLKTFQGQQDVLSRLAEVSGTTAEMLMAELKNAATAVKDSAKVIDFT